MKWVDNGRRMAERAKELFPPGTRIQLIHMDDPYNPIPDGTRGTVKFVDDMGTVFPDWDNGRGLGVVYGEDSFRKLTPEELLEEQQKEDINQDSIMYISHRIPEILRISDNIIVLRDGCLTGTLSPREADEESIITAMSGRKINMSVYQTREIKDDTILEVRNLGYKNQYQNITFSLKPGEILGMYGLVGSGRSEIARAIFGETKAETGNIIFEGKDITGTDINGAIEKNIFYVPEDRGAQGLFDIHPIRDNMSVSFLDGFSNKFSFIRKKEERKAVQDNIEKYSIKTPSQDLSVNSLSGGGQQKVLLCRWLMRKPKVLILDEPTRGIDVATKAEIHKYIMELAAEGVAILVISSDLPEIMGVSDRILTLHKGTITAEFDRETVTEEKILKNAPFKGDIIFYSACPEI